MDILINPYIAVLAGLMLLTYCADTLVESSILVAKKFNLSKVFIGITIIGFGSSLPEVITTSSASQQGLYSLAISTVVGSNIANIALLLGFCLMISKSWPDMTKHKPDLFFMLISYAILLISIYFGLISQAQGFCMAILLLIFIYLSLKLNKESDFDIEEPCQQNKTKLEISLGIILGLIGLAIGAEMLINGSVAIAQEFNISEKIIGITLVALGTSLPEAAACISAVRKGETGLVLGNIVGSNMFNILAALGIAGAFNPIKIENFNLDSIFLFIVVLMVIPFFYKKQGNHKLYGLILLAIYAIYIYSITI